MLHADCVLLASTHTRGGSPCAREKQVVSSTRHIEFSLLYLIIHRYTSNSHPATILWCTDEKTAEHTCLVQYLSPLLSCSSTSYPPSPSSFLYSRPPPQLISVIINLLAGLGTAISSNSCYGKNSYSCLMSSSCTFTSSGGCTGSGMSGSGCCKGTSSTWDEVCAMSSSSSSNCKASTVCKWKC